MELTQDKPGKKLGYVLHALLEEVLTEPSRNSEEYLEKRALELYNEPEEALAALASAGKEALAAEEAEALKAIAREHKVG